jgi:hypothetical protein
MASDTAHATAASRASTGQKYVGIISFRSPVKRREFGSI